MEDTMTDIFSVQGDVNQMNVPINQSSKPVNLVPIDQMIKNEQKVQPSTVKRKKDKILIIQVILLVIWGVLTAVVYFFGYDLLSPFINV